MRVVLRTHTGSYVSVHHRLSGLVTADRRTAGPWESFTLTDHGNGTLSLQAMNGRYLSAARSFFGGFGGHDFGATPPSMLYASGRAAGNTERFRRIDRGNGTIALQTLAGGYVGVDEHGRHLVFDRTTAGPRETFRLLGRESWMETSYDLIAQKTLAQLCLPGTHDSGTYELFDELAPDATDAVRQLWSVRMGKATGIGEFVKGMAITQRKNFYDQFRAGIRYVDLRVCWMHNEFFTCHTLRGNRISLLLQDVRRFLDENPKEVIVFKVGLKGMTGNDVLRRLAWEHLTNQTGAAFYRPAIGELLAQTFAQLVDANRRAIFLSDGAENIDGIYHSSWTTNAIVGENLRRRSESFAGGRLLEAQFLRPISDNMFVEAYLQKHGCRLLPALSILAALPFVGVVLANIGAAALVGFLAYLRNFSASPTDLVQNARDSRSILHDYIRWLGANPNVPRPQLLMADFIEEVPLVDVGIALSVGQPFVEWVDGVDDIRPGVSPLERFVVFDCTADAMAAAFHAAGYLAETAGDWIKKYLPALEAIGLGSALKAAGYLLNAVGDAVRKLYELIAPSLNHVLVQIGYAGREIVRFFNSLGQSFQSFFRDFAEMMNPRNWFRRRSTEPTAADAFLDKLEDDDFREELLPELADLAPGDWDGFARIGRAAGFALTTQELIAVMPDGFFLGAGQHPELGWNVSTLPA